MPLRWIAEFGTSKCDGIDCIDRPDADMTLRPHQPEVYVSPTFHPVLIDKAHHVPDVRTPSVTAVQPEIRP